MVVMIVMGMIVVGEMVESVYDAGHGALLFAAIRNVAFIGGGKAKAAFNPRRGRP